MKQLLLCFISLLIAVIPYSATAQQRADVTITDTRSFVLQKLDAEGNLVTQGQFSATFTAQYTSKEGMFKIKVNAGDDSIKLLDPLNRAEFRNELTAKLNTSERSVSGLSEYSVEQVFIWVYSLKQGNVGPQIGRLNLGYLTKPFNTAAVDNSPERINELEEANNRNSLLNALAASHKKNILLHLSQIFKDTADSKKPYYEKTTKSKDFLATIDTLFKQEVFPELDKNEFADLTKFVSTDTSRSIKKNETDLVITSIRKSIHTSDSLLKVAVRECISAASELDSISAKITNTTNDSSISSLGRMKELAEKFYYLKKKDSLDLEKKIKADSALLSKRTTESDSLRIIMNFTGMSPLVGADTATEFITTEAERLYKAYLEFQKVKKKVELLHQSMKENGIFPIAKISLQFERGHIERVQVWVQNKNGVLDIYENIYAIGFSSTNNLKAFQSIRLFIRKSQRAGFNGGIFLSDALGNYDNMVDLFMRDYSPGDTTINELHPAHGPVSLHKEQNIRLFDSKVFMDLQGISEDEPNGLVQVEVSRRFNLNTYRIQNGATRTDRSYLAYLNVYGAISKIENKSKELILRNRNTVENGVIVSPSYATNLDLRKYENASLGIDLNTYLFDFPDMKFTAYVDAGVRYGHISLQDSVFNMVDGKPVFKELDTFSGHTITFLLPKVRFEFFSERRVGFNVCYNFNHTYALTNNRFKQLMSYEKSDLNNITTEKNARKSHMIEVFLRAETNREGNGQLFFRSRFFWQKGDANTFFPQTQVGYAYNIIYRK